MIFRSPEFGIHKDLKKKKLGKILPIQIKVYFGKTA